ncbi:MAG: hypothetical protein Q8N56_02320 [bacterium]|nr:hypothetical protein [bacterium]
MSFESIFIAIISWLQYDLPAIFKEWWWLFLIVEFFWLLQIAKSPWIFFRRWIFDGKRKPILLEIKIPEEVLEPIKAMETVLTGFWQICSPPNWYEFWWEGQSSWSFSLEIACIEGTPHFYVRTPNRDLRQIFEAQVYSQYPSAEISEVEDYVKDVPQDIPNEQWDLFGTGYKNLKPWAYPIKTYEEFETGKEEEEKRIDPIASLLEGMAKLGPGEQAWVQIRCFPVLDEAQPWKKDAWKLRDELARRKSKDYKPKPMIQEAAEFLISGKVPEAPKDEVESFVPVEMKLTPGERLIILAMEKKIGKLWFLCAINWAYLGKKDVFFKPKARLIMSYFTNFVTDDMNGLVPDGKTITKVTKHWYDFFLFIKRRTYLRKRKIFRALATRTWVGWPRDGIKGPRDTEKRFCLDAGELASLYHFPGRIVAQAPTMARVEAKKGEAPSTLPME